MLREELTLGRKGEAGGSGVVFVSGESHQSRYSRRRDVRLPDVMLNEKEDEEEEEGKQELEVMLRDESRK